MSEIATAGNDIDQWEMEMSRMLIPLGDSATGTIEPQLQDEVFRRLIEQLGGDTLYRQAEGEIIAKCIDGRNCAHPAHLPNSAGGTLSIAVARDLVDEHDGALGFDAHFAAVLADCAAQHIACGGHEAAGGDGDHTGCGASDKLADIYQKMVEASDEIARLAESLSIDISARQKLITNARRRVAFAEFGSSGMRRNAVAKDGVLETLEGTHNEAVIVINLRTGTTLDREALGRECGKDTQVFNVDAWAFEPTVRAFAHNPDDAAEVAAGVAALAYFNLAAALVLCGPAMSIIVRQ